MRSTLVAVLAMACAAVLPVQSAVAAGVAEDAPELLSRSTTIYNHTPYLVYFNISCTGDNWLTHALDVGTNSNYDCLSNQTIRVRFKKSWLPGCPNVDQTYTLSAAHNYFQATACGMDLYAGP